MQPAKIAAIVLVTCSSLGCDAIVRATVDAARSQAYAKAHAMGGLDDTSLTIATSGVPVYPPTAANPLAFRRLVIRHEYATLDSLLTAAADSARSDYRNESYLFSAYDAMAYDTALAEPLARWSRESKSAPAHLARASYLLSQAWAARGTADVHNTSWTRMHRMHALLAEAKACIDSALVLTPQSAEAYFLLLATTKPSGDTALSRHYLEKGLEDIPASFSLRRRHLENLIPRWGGSYAAMRAFVKESEPMANTNPRLRALVGYVFLDYAEVWELRRHPDKDKAFENYDWALKLADEPAFHVARGQALLRADRAQDALADLDAAIDAGDDEAYYWRGVAREILWHADRTNRDLAFSALADYQHAVVLDPLDDRAVGLFLHLDRAVR